MYILCLVYTFVKQLHIKYTNKMTIPKKLLKKWEIELKGYGIMRSSVEMDLNYRTIRTAIKSGGCTQNVYDRINNFLIAKREEINVKADKVLTSIEQD